MLTSVRISDALGEQARDVAQQRGVSFTAFVQTAIRNEVQRQEIADLEKRIVGSFQAHDKHLDRLAEANRAGFALFFALTRELLLHIYPDPLAADAQLDVILRTARADFAGHVKTFFQETHGE